MAVFRMSDRVNPPRELRTTYFKRLNYRGYLISPQDLLLVMECQNCEMKQRQFYCENCLRTHLRDYRNQIQHVAADKEEHVARASRALEFIRPVIVRRADVTLGQKKVEDVLEGLAELKRKNDKTRERIQSLQRSLSSRRVTLATAKSLVNTQDAVAPNFLSQNITRESQQLANLSDTIARARVGLVQELVEVFDVVQVGGRPAVGGMKGVKGEWTIGGLVLPVPGDVRRYPPQYINAALTHTIHFANLLSFYLGVKLPFQIEWSGRGLGIGVPLISAGRGTEVGGWSKWSSQHILHLSSSSPASTSHPIAAANYTMANELHSSISISPESLTDSTLIQPRKSSTSSPDDRTSSDSSHQTFTTAFAMLSYNVCYLAYTQCVEISLSQAGDVLSNLWAICCSNELGRRSHATAFSLPPPTPSTFGLDFSQLLQATTASPTRIRPLKSSSSKHNRKRRDNMTIVEEDEEGWDLMNDVAP